MKHVVGSEVLKVLWGPVLLTALAAHANAGTFGVCLLSTAFGSGGASNAEYASANITAGCNPGFFPSIVGGGSVSPASFAPGLTAATLTVTQPMPFGGTAVAISTASLDQGVLREESDTAGPLGGCGGTCMTTGGRAIAESLFGDSLTFNVSGGGSAQITVNAHLDGTIGFTAGSSANNYSIQEQFALGGSGCWGSATGLGFAPCGSQNFGFGGPLFTSQSATGFDFSGTFTVNDGQTLPFYAALDADCSGGANCNFSNTALFSLTLPSNVTYTSDSTVLFTQPVTAPEPGSLGVIGAGVLAVGVLRRRIGKHQQ